MRLVDEVAIRIPSMNNNHLSYATMIPMEQVLANIPNTSVNTSVNRCTSVSCTTYVFLEDMLLLVHCSGGNTIWSMISGVILNSANGIRSRTMNSPHFFFLTTTPDVHHTHTAASLIQADAEQTDQVTDAVFPRDPPRCFCRHPMLLAFSDNERWYYVSSTQSYNADVVYNEVVRRGEWKCSAFQFGPPKENKMHVCKR
jgi:hypothetical protein